MLPGKPKNKGKRPNVDQKSSDFYQRLEQAQASVPNQLGKATRTPTMRWIFQLFEGVHLLIHKTRKKTEEIILNMNPVRCHVLATLGPQFEKIYSNS